MLYKLMIISILLATRYLLLATYYLLLATRYLLLTTYYLLLPSYKYPCWAKNVGVISFWVEPDETELFSLPE